MFIVSLTLNFWLLGLLPVLVLEKQLEIMFFMKESFKLCSIPPTVNRWLSATPACKYPDKKTAKPYCIENMDKSNLILMTFKVKAFHGILYLLFIHYKNTIVLWWLSCDWMFTSHFPFIVAKRKKRKREMCVCTSIIRNAFLIFW